MRDKDILGWILHQTEGQFFERKSCFDRSGAKTKLRPAKDVAKDIVETLSAMANADGGTLVVGIEDDGEEANRIAQRLTEAGLLVSVGEKRGRHYIPRH
jgi:hypothetical protein